MSHPESRLLALVLALCSSLGLLACCQPAASASPGQQSANAAPSTPPTPSPAVKPTNPAADPASTTQLATLAGGCFWCVEAGFETLPGVLDVRSGFTGGDTKDPSYEEVCTGTTNHAEAVEIRFDPSKTSYQQLLELFFRLHDPTTPNRQGADTGTQYRSAIFFHDAAQEAAAKAAIAAAQSRFGAPIVTEVVPAGPFYLADEHHQDFYRNNKNHPYCRAVIQPKLDKLQGKH